MTLSTRSVRRPAWFSFLALMAALFSQGVGGGETRALETDEYRIKAGFIVNFVKFVKWPATSGSNDAPVIRFCVIGESPISEELAAIEGKIVQGKRLVPVQKSGRDEFKDCNLAYISKRLSGNVHTLVKKLQQTSVLTISDMEHFTEAGGHIQFHIIERKIRFSINDRSARSAGLEISSRLLSLAHKVTR